MAVFCHELKRGRLSLMIWTAVISFMLGVCVFIYPEMSSQMGQISEMFANMGDFSAAFGMDQLNFGEFRGYFGIECGNTLGLGGAFFAAILGIAALSKEEKERTADFLLTHPLSRGNIITGKLLAVLTQILILNITVAAVSVLSMVLIGEQDAIADMGLLFLAYTILQIEIAAITFGISAFLKNGSLGIGLGLAVTLYFLNLVSNLTEDARFLKYITPFGYTDASAILADQVIEMKHLAVGIALAVIGIIAGYWKYTKKDIA